MRAPMHLGDYLVGFCVYDSKGRDRYTNIGATHDDEMCNIYIMYSRRRKDPALTEFEESVCSNGISLTARKFTNLVKQIPISDFDYLPTKLPPTHRTSSKKELMTTPSRQVPVVQRKNFEIDAQLGQVVSVALDSRGLLYIFHRGPRKWDDDTFDEGDRFRNADKLGPIKEPTVVVVNRSSSAVVRTFGAGLFYLPHGITVDKADNVWLTDVALHQVLRFDKHNFTKPALVVGTRLQPGQDSNHFCKPTSVAVLPDGSFFVADGYCNSRIMAFSPKGDFLHSWGSAAGNFQVPHSLTLVNDSLLCCADRERARIECFRPADGQSLLTIKDIPDFGHQLFAISHVPNRQSLALYGVSYNGSDGAKVSE